MVSVRVFVCVILTVWELHCGLANHRGKTDWNSPIDFVYKGGDELKINIVLWNTPPMANNYVLLEQTAITEFLMIPLNKKIDLRKKLFGENITLEMELLEGDTVRSSKQLIINGKKVDKNNRSSKEDEKQFEIACLNKKENFCQIHVDFNKMGMDKEVTIAPKPGTNGAETPRRSHIDETSQIKSASRPGTNGAETPRRSYNNETSQIYSASRPGTNGTETSRTISAPRAGTSNAETSRTVGAPRPGTSGAETSRTVGAPRPGTSGAETSRTVDTPRPGTSGAETSRTVTAPRPGTNGAKTPRSDRDDHAVNTPKPAVQDQTPSETPHYVTSSSPAGVSEDRQKTDQQNSPLQASDYTKYYIAMALAAAVLLLASLMYVIVKKCTRRASDPEVKLQLETYASTDLVYAQLDIKPGNALPPAPTIENTNYAQIIGVLMPVNNVKK